MARYDAVKCPVCAWPFDTPGHDPACAGERHRPTQPQEQPYATVINLRVADDGKGETKP